jgi:hypothetical protein
MTSGHRHFERYKLKPSKPWDQVKVTKRHRRVLLHLARVLRMVHSRKFSEWVKLVAYVYDGQRLPGAVAASITRLQKYCEGTLTIPPESVTKFDPYED